MRVSPAIISAVALLFGSCGPMAKLPDPTRADIQPALKRLLDASNPSWGRFYAGNTLSACTPGTVNEVEVRSCKVCALVAYKEDSGFMDSLPGAPRAVARREVFNITFKRGLSYEQPDVVPAKRGDGVWVALIPPSPSQFMPPQVSKTVLASKDLRYSDAGITTQARSFLENDYFRDGRKLSEKEVRRWYIELSREQLQEAVGTCS